ncbi:RNA-binding domain-containing protein [Aaosphaeria arxii CBS 175.79]|uniref:RNA-binding domain-containing protein n=1 Tax=Aaosphaeria arxii CBS 175.79 TaxID=1450172 RepID=A0A6A5XIK0_9PLEO|nr:RNA-binding domain-containing protein [Aaosphaeria arxii CBS 175.79]KAF2012610.1 RNA-binding domain-containing protein [Aaosphaeria arxii CBS 175.79]
MSGATGARHWEQDKEATVYVGNIDERVTDQLIWELMLQAGRIQNVHLPKDRVTQTHQGYGFVEFMSEEDAEYAAKIMNQIRLHGKPIRVNKASADKQKTIEVGADLFIGNLDPMVDESMLYNTFRRFGNLTSVPKIQRDEAGLSKGFAFISYDDFDSSDAAKEHMNEQYIMNKAISVEYAFKKDNKNERHGDEAERRLAKQAKARGVMPAAQPLPAQLFQTPVHAPSGPQSMMNGDGRGMPPTPTAPGFGGPPHARPPVLPPPPSGLPARPPSGAPPAGFNPYVPPPQGFNAPPPGFMPGQGPPGQGPPGQGPPGYGPPGAGPPGFSHPPPGYPRR